MNDNQSESTDLAIKANESKTIEYNKSSLLDINVLDNKSIEAAEFYLSKIIASKNSSIKSIPDGMAILLRAKDLNIPFSSAAENMHVINGKTGIGIHVIKALLLRAGVIWEQTKNYTPLYYYTDGSNIYNESLPDYCVRCANPKSALDATKDDKVGVYPLQYYSDLNGKIYKETEVSSKCVKCFNKGQAMEIAKNNQFPVIRLNNIPYDYVSEYKFTRMQIINGNEYVRTAISQFSRADAINAELVEKDNYKHYEKTMISHRAFVIGAREIADDLLMGLMETTELKMSMGKRVSDEDFEESEIINVENDVNV